MRTATDPLSIENLSLAKKIEGLKKIFTPLDTPAEKYHLLIDLGRNLSPIDAKYKVEDYLVEGCQSQLYIHAEKREGRIFFSAGTDALISAGLAALLLEVYNGETVETILTFPPHFLQELGIYASLSPNRAHGVINIYQKMKRLSILLPLQ
jgi:cysteine desulfuration protein SufE